MGKKVIKISEKQLQKIIRESINKHLNKNDQDTSFDLSKYLDSIPYEELKQQYEDYTSYEIINGYDILQENFNEDELSNAHQAADEIKNKFHLKDWQVIIAAPNNKVEIIVVYAGLLRNSKKIKNAMLSQKFFDSRTWWTFKKGMLWRAIKFEPLKQPDLTKEAKSFDKLFHLSLMVNMASIKVNGLVPCHKNNFFKYPDRVYVLYGNITENQIIYLGKQLYEKDKQNPQNNGNYVLYSIDTKKLPNNIRFYGDPNYRYGYFTEETIPPQALSIIKTYNF